MAHEVILFRLASTDPVRIWSGNGDILIGPDAVEPVAIIYRGAGELLNMPAVLQLINGTAERVEFSISGVTAKILALALSERDSVYGAEARIGTLALDADLQPDSPVLWEWRGIADVITLRIDPVKDGGHTRQLTLSVGSADTARSRPDLSYFTDADQRRRSSDDAIFDHVAGIAASTTRRFGPHASS